ncbi:hypothetical protein GGF46_005522, partial [Coemansia sp. RSA 552]
MQRVAMHTTALLVGADELASVAKTDGVRGAPAAVSTSGAPCAKDASSKAQQKPLVVPDGPHNAILPGTHNASSSSSSRGQNIRQALTSTEDSPDGLGGDNADAAIAHIMEAMDQELAATHVGKSFARHDQSSDTAAQQADDDSASDEVDIDLNLVRNIVDSFRAQEGLPGPAGTMLGQAGIHLPHL